MPSEEAATMTKDHQLSVVESILAYAKDRSNPVFIRDIDGVARKLQAIIESGKEKLHIISGKYTAIPQVANHAICSHLQFSPNERL